MFEVEYYSYLSEMMSISLVSYTLKYINIHQNRDGIKGNSKMTRNEFSKRFTKFIDFFHAH